MKTGQLSGELFIYFPKQFEFLKDYLKPLLSFGQVILIEMCWEAGPSYYLVDDLPGYLYRSGLARLIYRVVLLRILSVSFEVM